MSPPNIRLRGIRAPIPGGYVLGRKAGAQVGEVQLLSSDDLHGHGIARLIDVAAVTLAIPVTVPNGGTGDTAFTAHGVVLGEGVAALGVTAVGTTGQVLTGVTGADPVWASPAATFKDWRPLTNGSLPGAIMFDAKGQVIAVFI